MIQWLEQAYSQHSSLLQQFPVTDPAEQLPRSQHLDSLSQQSVVQTQLVDAQEQVDVKLVLMANMVPATINNNTVETVTSLLLICLFVNLLLFPVCSREN
jgi:hypothetical protein